MRMVRGWSEPCARVPLLLRSPFVWPRDRIEQLGITTPNSRGTVRLEGSLPAGRNGVVSRLNDRVHEIRKLFLRFVTWPAIICNHLNATERRGDIVHGALRMGQSDYRPFRQPTG